MYRFVVYYVSIESQSLGRNHDEENNLLCSPQLPSVPCVPASMRTTEFQIAQHRRQ